MSFLLILFFASLLGITIMIGRKLILLRNQPMMIVEEKNLFQSPNLGEIRYIFIRKTKAYVYVVIVSTIRLSIRSSKLLKHTYKKVKNKIKNITNKHIKHNKEEETKKEKEVSSFLKKISEYKHKIRKIKNQVIEEEKEK